MSYLLKLYIPKLAITQEFIMSLSNYGLPGMSTTNKTMSSVIHVQWCPWVTVDFLYCVTYMYVHVVVQGNVLCCHVFFTFNSTSLGL